MGRDGKGRHRMGWDGMGWDGMGRDRMGRDGKKIPSWAAFVPPHARDSLRKLGFWTGHGTDFNAMRWEGWDRRGSDVV